MNFRTYAKVLYIEFKNYNVIVFNATYMVWCVSYELMMKEELVSKLSAISYELQDLCQGTIYRVQKL